METKMKVCIGDTEFRIGWEKKMEDKDEKKAELMEAIGDVIKYTLKVSSQHFNLVNPTLRDIGNDIVYIKSVTSHKISPIFVVSTQADGVKTAIGVILNH